MSKYRAPDGRYLTQALFKETIQTSVKKTYTPPFTLKPEDSGKCISMKRLYLEIADPTEYAFAMEVLGSWEHWLKLTNCEWFQPYLTAWREELELKLRSKGIKAMMDLAVSGKDNAAKWLAEGGWNGKSKRGRPSKAEVTAERKKKAKMIEEVEDYASRIGLH